MLLRRCLVCYIPSCYGRYALALTQGLASQSISVHSIRALRWGPSEIDSSHPGYKGKSRELCFTIVYCSDEGFERNIDIRCRTAEDFQTWQRGLTAYQTACIIDNPQGGSRVSPSGSRPAKAGLIKFQARIRGALARKRLGSQAGGSPGSKGRLPPSSSSNNNDNKNDGSSNGMPSSPSSRSRGKLMQMSIDSSRGQQGAPSAAPSGLDSPNRGPTPVFSSAPENPRNLYVTVLQAADIPAPHGLVSGAKWSSYCVASCGTSTL